MINFLIGFAIAFIALFAIGMTKARKMSDTTWARIWAVFSAAFLAVNISGLYFDSSNVYRMLLGVNSAYIIGVAIHLYTHLK